MKTFRDKDGRERPHFEPSEIDRTCAAELRKVGLLPATPEPIRIDRFIEKRFGVVPEYDDLPDGVLGYSEFGPNGVAKIVVLQELAESDSVVARRRLRATFAHEAGHCLLHAHLFALAAPHDSLFGKDNCSGRSILCREVLADDSRSGRPKSSWSEWQANRAIGGLLIPTGLMRTALEPFMVSAGSLGGLSVDPGRVGEAQRLLSETFDVNPIVSKIRLDDLLGPETGGQTML